MRTAGPKSKSGSRNLETAVYSAVRKTITRMALANFQYPHKQREDRLQNSWNQPIIHF
jgi:hypothetical protein